MPLSDFPELKVLFDKLMAERDALVAKAQPYRDEREKLRAQMAPLEDKEREMIRQFQALEQPRLAEIDMQLSALARSVPGGYVLTSEGPAPPAPRG